MSVYRNKLGQFRSRRNKAEQFIGRRLWAIYQPEWTKPLADRGARSERILAEHPGIMFETYRELGGSVTCLARAVKHECVNAW